MDTTRYERIREVFVGACELGPAGRDRYLDEACRSDPDLKREVVRLLADDAAGSRLLAARTSSPEQREALIAELLDPVPAPEHPPRIGRYRIIRTIARGGMGTVYQAEQDTPRRTVALKMVRPELATEEALRRFVWETQVLGLLQHPSIAQIHEAGNADTPWGRQPYFAMEFVEGVPITDHVRANGLPAAACLRLLADICDAVHYAHQRGIIHRDLKPGNILVANGRPKILDFGIARATDPDVVRTAPPTATGHAVGTLPYMSPEQASGDPARVDTRADVYALGVIAYEMLSGAPPFAGDGGRGPRLPDAVPPDEPTRLGRIDRALRGDVETIVAKAMARDKERRYDSAAALGADIRRCLCNEPIVARPPSTFYQLRKFARRRRAAFIGIASSLALLVAGAAGTTLGMVRARTGQHTALEARDEANAVADFFTDAIGLANPRHLGGAATIGEMLDSAAENIGSLGDRPRVEAQVRHTIGVAYRDMGRHEEARHHLETAWRLRKQKFGPAHLVTAETTDAMGELCRRTGDFEQALALHESALAVHRAHLGDDHLRTLVSWHNTALTLQQLGRLDESLARWELIVPLCCDSLGDDSVTTMASQSSQAITHLRLGHHAEAVALLEDLHERYALVLDPAHPDAIVVSLNLAKAYRVAGRLQEAEAMLLGAEAAAKSSLDPSSLTTIAIVNDLAIIRSRLGRVDAAITAYSDLLTIMFDALGPRHPRSLVTLGNLARELASCGETEAALAMQIGVHAGQSAQLGDDHYNTLITMNSLAGTHIGLGNLREAEHLLSAVLTARLQSVGPLHRESLVVRNNLAVVHLKLGELELAEEMFREMIHDSVLALGRDHKTTIDGRQSLAVVLRARGMLEESEQVLRDVIRDKSRVFGPESVQVSYARTRLGETLYDAGRLDQAETTLVEAVRMLATAHGGRHPETQRAVRQLTAVYRDTGQDDRVRALELEGAQAVRR